MIAAWLPLFLFAVLFGLSMDYTVFLLSRIRERVTEGARDEGGRRVRASSSTARLITGAALIIIAVFVGFAAGDQVEFQQMGFGVAVSLLIDATVVRLVLLPAVLALLGERTWYLPGGSTGSRISRSRGGAERKLSTGVRRRSDAWLSRRPSPSSAPSSPISRPITHRPLVDARRQGDTVGGPMRRVEAALEQSLEARGARVHGERARREIRRRLGRVVAAGCDVVRRVGWKSAARSWMCPRPTPSSHCPPPYAPIPRASQ